MTATNDSPSWVAPSRPMGPAPGLRYAGFWIRTLAYLIDAALLAVAMAIVAGTTGIGFFDVTVRDSTFGGFSNRSFFVQLNPLSLLAALLYFAGQWWLRGQTVGMAPLGLRILRATDGRSIGPGRAIGRFFGLILSFFVFAIGVIWVAADGRKQGWHDKLAGTVVVRPSGGAIAAAPAGVPE
jgi:uncharacterized RDD family membrane protein YckC